MFQTEATTNISGVKLPAVFRFVRYASQTAASKEGPRYVSLEYRGQVHHIEQVHSGIPSLAEVARSAGVLVTGDHRFVEELKGATVHYTTTDLLITNLSHPFLRNALESARREMVQNERDLGDTSPSMETRSLYIIMVILVLMAPLLFLVRKQTKPKPSNH